MRLNLRGRSIFSLTERISVTELRSSDVYAASVNWKPPLGAAVGCLNSSVLSVKGEKASALSRSSCYLAALSSSVQTSNLFSPS